MDYEDGESGPGQPKLVFSFNVSVLVPKGAGFVVVVAINEFKEKYFLEVNNLEEAIVDKEGGVGHEGPLENREIEVDQNEFKPEFRLHQLEFFIY